ncbi:hypothetical protein MMC26_003541 [Xylographa opegraphella]|nr:hypothetical protein [Xylographa opegraphella]
MPPSSQTSFPASAVTTLLRSQAAPSSLTHPAPYHHLAIQVLHNLQYQHDWTNLRVHTHSTPSEIPSHHSTSPPDRPRLLPRPLVSGLPPNRIYVHPDEQVEMLLAGRREQDVLVEREWVLPTHLREKWSLRKFADVFDAVGEEPPEGIGEGGEEGESGLEREATDGPGVRKDGTRWGVDPGPETSTRRGGKRVLLATVSDDSTVVYYIVHEGLVKPRQN